MDNVTCVARLHIIDEHVYLAAEYILAYCMVCTLTLLFYMHVKFKEIQDALQSARFAQG